MTVLTTGLKLFLNWSLQCPTLLSFTTVCWCWDRFSVLSSIAPISLLSMPLGITSILLFCSGFRLLWYDFFKIYIYSYIDNFFWSYRPSPLQRRRWILCISSSRCTTLVLIWAVRMFRWSKWTTWVLGWIFAVLSFRCLSSHRIIIILMFPLPSSRCFLNGIARNGLWRLLTVWMVFCYRRLMVEIIYTMYHSFILIPSSIF